MCQPCSTEGAPVRQGLLSAVAGMEFCDVCDAFSFPLSSFQVFVRVRSVTVVSHYSPTYLAMSCLAAMEALSSELCHLRRGCWSR